MHSPLSLLLAPAQVAALHLLLHEANHVRQRLRGPRGDGGLDERLQHLLHLNLLAVRLGPGTSFPFPLSIMSSLSSIGEYCCSMIPFSTQYDAASFDKATTVAT